MCQLETSGCEADVRHGNLAVPEHAKIGWALHPLAHLLETPAPGLSKERSSVAMRECGRAHGLRSAGCPCKDWCPWRATQNYLRLSNDWRGPLKEQ